MRWRRTPVVCETHALLLEKHLDEHVQLLIDFVNLITKLDGDIAIGNK